MLKLKIRVVMTDGTDAEYLISPKVQVEFERQYKTGIGKAFESDFKMEHGYWLAWKAAHYAGVQVKPFDSWLDGVESINMVSDTAPLDETP